MVTVGCPVPAAVWARPVSTATLPQARLWMAQASGMEVRPVRFRGAGHGGGQAIAQLHFIRTTQPDHLETLLPSDAGQSAPLGDFGEPAFVVAPGAEGQGHIATALPAGLLKLGEAALATELLGPQGHPLQPGAARQLLQQGLEAAHDVDGQVPVGEGVVVEEVQVVVGVPGPDRHPDGPGGKGQAHRLAEVDEGQGWLGPPAADEGPGIGFLLAPALDDALGDEVRVGLAEDGRADGMAHGHPADALALGLSLGIPAALEGVEEGNGKDDIPQLTGKPNPHLGRFVGPKRLPQPLEPSLGDHLSSRLPV